MNAEIMILFAATRLPQRHSNGELGNPPFSIDHSQQYLAIVIVDRVVEGSQLG